MSPERTALAPRPESALAAAPITAELRAILERCPACGAPCGRVVRCAECGHAYERALWKLDPSARRSFLSLLVDTPDGNYGLLGAISLTVLGLSFYSGIRWPLAVAALFALMAVGVTPALLVGLRALVRWSTRRQWIYNAPDHVTCVARGTRWRLDTFVRVRPTALQEITAPEAIEALLPSHAQALLARPAVLRAVEPQARPRPADPERTAALLALAIAIAKLQIAGRLRVVRGSIITVHERDGHRSQSETAVYGLVANGAIEHGDAFERWVFAKVPHDTIERNEAGYRDAAQTLTVHSIGEWPELDAVIAAMHDELRGARPSVSMGHAIHGKLAALTPWSADAPIVSEGSLRYLGSLVVAISSAFSQAEFGKAKLL